MALSAVQTQKPNAFMADLGFTAPVTADLASKMKPATPEMLQHQLGAHIQDGAVTTNLGTVAISNNAFLFENKVAVRWENPEAASPQMFSFLTVDDAGVSEEIVYTEEA